MDVRDMLLVNIFCEGRFSTSLGVISKLEKFQNEFKDDYPFANFDSEESKATLINKKDNSTRSLYLSSKNFGAGDSDCRDKDIYIEQAKRLNSFVIDNLGVSNFQRFGVRANFILPLDEEKSEVKLFLRKLFGKNALNQVGKAFGEFTLEFRTKAADETKFKYAISLVNRDIDDDYYPKHGMLIDIDQFYDGEIDAGDIHSYMENSVHKSRTAVQNFIHNIIIRKE